LLLTKNDRRSPQEPFSRHRCTSTVHLRSIGSRNDSSEIHEYQERFAPEAAAIYAAGSSNCSRAARFFAQNYSLARWIAPLRKGERIAFLASQHENKNLRWSVHRRNRGEKTRTGSLKAPSSGTCGSAKSRRQRVLVTSGDQEHVPKVHKRVKPVDSVSPVIQ